MRDFREHSELLRDALELLEKEITTAVKPADGPIQICSDRAETVGFDHTLPELTTEKLREMTRNMAVMINEKGYPLSIPLPKTKATAFCGVATGNKVDLRLTVLYDIKFDRFIARFDCMTCEPTAVEVAA